MKNFYNLSNLLTNRCTKRTGEVCNHSCLLVLFFVLLFAFPNMAQAETYMGNLFVLGQNLSPCYWDPNKALEFTNYKDGTYSWCGELIAESGDGFKFLCSKGNWNPAFTAAEWRVDIASGNEYGMKYKQSDNDPDNKFMLQTNAGIYRLDIDLTDKANGKMRVTKVDESIKEGHYYLVGDFTNPGGDWIKENGPHMLNEVGYVSYRFPVPFEANTSTRFKILKDARDWAEVNQITYSKITSLSAPDGIKYDTDGDGRIRITFTKKGYLTMCYGENGENVDKVFAKFEPEQVEEPLTDEFYVFGAGDNDNWVKDWTHNKTNVEYRMTNDDAVAFKTFTAVQGHCEFKVYNKTQNKELTWADYDESRTEGLVCSNCAANNFCFDLQLPFDVTVYTDGAKVWAKVNRQKMENKTYYLQGDYNGWHTWNNDTYRFTKVDDYLYTITKTWKYEDIQTDYAKRSNPDYQLCDQQARCKMVPTNDDCWNDQWNITNIDAATSHFIEGVDCQNDGDTRIVIDLENQEKEIVFYIWKDGAGNKKISVIENAATPLDMVVEPADSKTLDKATYVNNFILQAEQARSGQLLNPENLRCENAYFQLKLTKDGRGLNDRVWYDFSVPFDVDMQHGIYHIEADGATGSPLVYNTDYQVWEYDGALRASTGNGWTRATGSVIKAGKTYLIGFANGWDPQETTFRFRAKDANLPAAATSLSLQAYPAADEGECHWNGLGNPSLRHISIAGTTMVQVCDINEEGAAPAYVFNPVELTGSAIVVGTAFFVQGTDPLTLTDANSTVARRAPQQPAERLVFDVEILRDGQMNNRLYATATADATLDYEQGRDMASWNGNYDEVATVWIDAYGKQLAVCDAPLGGSSISYAMGIHAPYAGEYVLHSAARYANATLWLLREGVPVWNLSESDCPLSLFEGTTHDYSLLIVREPNHITTGIHSVSGNSGVVKFIHKGMLCICIDGVLYDATGRMIK